MQDACDSSWNNAMLKFVSLILVQPDVQYGVHAVDAASSNPQKRGEFYFLTPTLMTVVFQLGLYVVAIVATLAFVIMTSFGGLLDNREHFGTALAVTLVLGAFALAVAVASRRQVFFNEDGLGSRSAFGQTKWIDWNDVETVSYSPQLNRVSVNSASQSVAFGEARGWRVLMTYLKERFPALTSQLP